MQDKSPSFKSTSAITLWSQNTLCWHKQNVNRNIMITENTFFLRRGSIHWLPASRRKNSKSVPILAERKITYQLRVNPNPQWLVLKAIGQLVLPPCVAKAWWGPVLRWRGRAGSFDDGGLCGIWVQLHCAVQLPLLLLKNTNFCRHHCKSYFQILSN